MEWNNQKETDMSYGDVLRWGDEFLRSNEIEEASIDAWYLLEAVTGMNRTRFLMERTSLMCLEQKQKYEELIKRRALHIPLQHLTGEQEFMGFSFKVNEHVLVPRQDTEVLVEETLKVLRPGDSLLDMCTGSGCIAISLSKLCPGISAVGADISKKALEVAEWNGKNLGTEVRWIQSDLFGNITEQYDIIVSNPPYIRTAVIATLSEEVREHEPFGALDGREDGLYFYRAIVKESLQHLKKGGWLLFEIGHDQGTDVPALLHEAGYQEISVIKDLAGLDRVVKAKR